MVGRVSLFLPAAAVAHAAEGGVGKPGLQELRNHGYNWIRLRIFHTPTEMPDNLAY